MHCFVYLLNCRFILLFVFQFIIFYYLFTGKEYLHQTFNLHDTEDQVRNCLNFLHPGCKFYLSTSSDRVQEAERSEEKLPEERSEEKLPERELELPGKVRILF